LGKKICIKKQARIGKNKKEPEIDLGDLSRAFKKRKKVNPWDPQVIEEGR
jgi:hypothetical protein